MLRVFGCAAGCPFSRRVDGALRLSFLALPLLAVAATACWGWYMQRVCSVFDWFFRTAAM